MSTKSLSYKKCSYCRHDRQRCLPEDRMWPGQRCSRCEHYNYPCSSSLTKAEERRSSQLGPNPFLQHSNEGSTSSTVDTDVGPDSTLLSRSAALLDPSVTDLLTGVSLTEVSDLRLLLECLCDLEKHEEELLSAVEPATLDTIRNRLNRQTKSIWNKISDRQAFGNFDEAYRIMSFLYCESSLNIWARSTGHIAGWEASEGDHANGLDLLEDVPTLVSHYTNSGDTASALKLQEDLTAHSASVEKSERIAITLSKMYQDFVERISRIDTQWEMLAQLTVIWRVVLRKLPTNVEVLPATLFQSTPRGNTEKSVLKLAVTVAASKDCLPLLTFFLKHLPPMYSKTALHTAARFDSSEAAKLLLRQGFRPDVMDTDKATALHLACAQRSIQVAMVLIANGANVNALDANHQTPLQLVLAWEDHIVPEARELQTQFIISLLHAGAEPHLGLGLDAFSASIRYCSPIIVRMMAQCLKELDRLDGNGALVQNPLQLAIQSLRLDSAYVLVEAGVQVHYIDDDGTTALHSLAKLQGHGQTKLIDCLVEHGALINQQDCFGNTPVHYGVQHNNLIITKHLLGLGARIDIINLAGQTPYDLATLEWNAPMCGILEQFGLRGSF